MAGKRRSVITIETHKLTLVRRSENLMADSDLGGCVDEVIETEKKQSRENAQRPYSENDVPSVATELIKRSKKQS